MTAGPENLRRFGGVPGPREEYPLQEMRERAETVAAVLSKPTLDINDIGLTLNLRGTATRKVVASPGFPAPFQIGGRQIWRTPLFIAWLDARAETATAERAD